MPTLPPNVNTVPSFPALPSPNSDLPYQDFPAVNRIDSSNLVGSKDSNKQPQSFEKRDITLARWVNYLVSSVNSIISSINAVDTYYIRKDLTNWGGVVGGLTIGFGGNELKDIADPTLTTSAATLNTANGARFYNEVVFYLGSPTVLNSVLNSVTAPAVGTNGSYVWTVPANIRRIFVIIIGAGGGGGGGNVGGNDNFGFDTTNVFGAGGGAGGVTYGFISVTPGNTYAITVGSRGIGGIVPGTGTGATHPDGSAGGNSSIGALASARGGSGGQTANFTTNPTAGGAGGSGDRLTSPVAATNAIVNAGGSGANGAALSGGNGGAVAANNPAANEYSYPVASTVNTAGAYFGQAGAGGSAKTSGSDGADGLIVIRY